LPGSLRRQSPTLECASFRGLGGALRAWLCLEAACEAQQAAAASSGPMSRAGAWLPPNPAGFVPGGPCSGRKRTAN